MKACPKCLETYRNQIEFCFRDGAVLQKLLSEDWSPPTRDIAEYKVLMSSGRGETCNFTLACLEDPLEDSDNVLLKSLGGEWSSSLETQERFLERYRAGASLQDPGFSAVLAVGHDSPGETVFAAIEHLNGWSFHDLMNRAIGRDRPPEPVLLLSMGAEFAEILGRLHAAELEPPLHHGSLGPQDLFILRDGSVRILNFGSAVPLDPFGSGSPQRYAYAAPEQLRGEVSGPRSDIYSLALILYSAVLGGNPYERIDGSETMLAALTEELVIEPPYDAVFGPALADSPDNRTNKMEDFAADLRRSLKTDVEGDLLKLRLEWIDDLTRR